MTETKKRTRKAENIEDLNREQTKKARDADGIASDVTHTKSHRGAFRLRRGVPDLVRSFLGTGLTLSRVSRASYVRARAFLGRGRPRYVVRMVGTVPDSRVPFFGALLIACALQAPKAPDTPESPP